MARIMSSAPTPTRTTSLATRQAARPASMSARRRTSVTARSPSVRPLPAAGLQLTTGRRRCGRSPSSSRPRRTTDRRAARQRLSVTGRRPAIYPLPAACLRLTVDQRRSGSSPSSSRARRVSVRRTTRRRLTVTVPSPSVRLLSGHPADHRRLPATSRGPDSSPPPAASSWRPSTDRRLRSGSQRTDIPRRPSTTARGSLTGGPAGRLPLRGTRNWERKVAAG